MRNTLLAGAIILAISAMPAWANTKGRHATAKAMSDQQFITKAAQAHIAEIELGKLAQSKASSSEVKNFAARMVADHEKALDDLKAIASKQNITLPTTLDPKAQALKDRLDKLSGSELNRAYMDAMLKDHRADVAEFHTESQRAHNPDVKQYAANTLPTLREHLRLAQSTRSAVVGTSGRSTYKKPVGQ